MNFFSLFKRKILYKLKRKIDIDIDGFNNDNLDELLHYYGSDKAHNFNKTKGHGFSGFYAQKLKFLKDKNINILEIGSYAGASAAAFKKYFKKSKIYCLDINISNFKYSSKDIYVFGLDVCNKKKLSKVLDKIKFENEIESFDLIIDDGSHNLSDILFSFNMLFKKLKKKGIYIIEDFKHPNYYKYNRNIDHILIDQMLDNLQDKKVFSSNIISKNDQDFFFKSIKKIDIFKGNLNDSDISFIEKN